MMKFGMLAAAFVALHPGVGAAHAQLQPTPAGWEAEQAIDKSAAWVDEQIAVFERKEPAANIKLALRRAQMLLPDDPVVTNQLAFYLGGGQPDDVYLDILAFRPDEPVANYYLAETLSGEGYVNLALPYYAKAASQRPNDAVVQDNAGMNAFYAEDDAACIAYLTRSLEIGGAVATDVAQARRVLCAGRQEEGSARGLRQGRSWRRLFGSHVQRGRVRRLRLGDGARWTTGCAAPPPRRTTGRRMRAIAS